MAGSRMMGLMAFGLVSAGSTLPTYAQIKIQDIPIDFAVAAETKLQHFGNYEVATTTASFAVRNVQASIDGALLGLSSSLACSAKNYTEVVVRSISLQQTLTQDAGLTISADAHVRECHSVPWYEGDVSISVPINFTHTAQVIALHADPRDVVVVASGFRFVGLVPAPSSLVESNARKLVTPKIDKLVSMIDGQIKRGLNSVKHWMATYSLAVQSSQVRYHDGDLIVSIQFSGQVPLATANKWLQSY
jgi:hypothetical protein